MRARDTAVEQAYGDMALGWSSEALQYRVAPGSLLSTAEPHEEGWSVLGASEFSNYVAMSDQAIQRGHICQGEQDLAFRETDRMRLQHNVERPRNTFERFAAPFAQPDFP